MSRTREEATRVRSLAFEPFLMRHPGAHVRARKWATSAFTRVRVRVSFERQARRSKSACAKCVHARILYETARTKIGWVGSELSGVSCGAESQTLDALWEFN